MVKEGIPDELKTKVVVKIFRWNWDVMSCGLHRGVKLSKQDMKIVERVWEENTIAGKSWSNTIWFHAWKTNDGWPVL